MKTSLTRLGTLALVSAASLMTSLPAFALQDAPNGVPIVGRVMIIDKFYPEPGIFDVGYVNLYVIEEGSNKVFEFHSEDSTCAALAARYHHESLCLRQAHRPEILALKIGERLRITQETHFFDGGRPSFEYEALE